MSPTRSARVPSCCNSSHRCRCDPHRSRSSARAPRATRGCPPPSRRRAQAPRRSRSCRSCALRPRRCRPHAAHARPGPSCSHHAWPGATTRSLLAWPRRVDRVEEHVAARGLALVGVLERVDRLLHDLRVGEVIGRRVLVRHAEGLQLDHVTVLVAEESQEAGDVLGQSSSAALSRRSRRSRALGVGWDGLLG
jgi:hypothetical protein